jgi:hypothetical protein
MFWGQLFGWTKLPFSQKAPLKLGGQRSYSWNILFSSYCCTWRWHHLDLEQVGHVVDSGDGPSNGGCCVPCFLFCPCRKIQKILGDVQCQNYIWTASLWGLKDWLLCVWFQFHFCPSRTWFMLEECLCSRLHDKWLLSIYHAKKEKLLAVYMKARISSA